MTFWNIAIIPSGKRSHNSQNSYLTLAVHITTHSFWHAKTIHANSGLLWIPFFLAIYHQHNLPQDELSSYRPISKLNFISKVLEHIIHARISSHLESFPSITPFQSAYQQFHSTETALLRIQNDLPINKQKVLALVLLDLSAAFDKVDHKILLSRAILFLWSLKPQHWI